MNQNSNLYGFLVNTLPKLLGGVCLAAFILFEEIWIALLVATVCFIYLFFAMVFLEKSVEWYRCIYLYAVVGCAVMTWLEYSYQILGRFV